MTLQQFKDAIKPSLVARTELIENTARIAGLKAKRSVADAEARTLADRVVAGTRADLGYGPDSPLWAAMGFVRTSDRSSGLTRKGKANTGGQTDEKSDSQA